METIDRHNGLRIGGAAAPFWVAIGLVTAISLAPTQALGQGASEPRAKSPIETPITDPSFRPESEFAAARLFLKFTGKQGRSTHEGARVILKYMLLSISEKEITQTRAFIKKNGWEPAFLKLFDKNVAWKDKIIAKRPEEIIELAFAIHEKHRLAPLYQNLVSALFILAKKRGNKSAPFVHAQLYLADESDALRREGYEMLWGLAAEGHLGAQLDLGLRYMEGHGTAKNIRKAYYWLVKVTERLDVGSPLLRLGSLLSKAERTEIRRQLDENIPPAY